MSNLIPHITIEEINSLTEFEGDMLLFICNIWAPIQPPMPSEKNPYPITLNIVRYAHRESIIDRVKQSVNVVKEEFFPIYEGLCKKLSIPIEKHKKSKKEEKKVEESPKTGMVTPPSTNTEMSDSSETNIPTKGLPPTTGSVEIKL